MLTAERLKRFAPNARADIVQALVAGQDEMAAAGITTPLRLQHFLSQISPETGASHPRGNLRYSAARSAPPSQRSKGPAMITAARSGCFFPDIDRESTALAGSHPASSRR